MKKQNLMSLAAVLSAGLMNSSPLTLPAQAQDLEIVYQHVETFDDPVPLADTPEDEKWYPDRYRPAAFETFDLNGENVLRVGIDADNDGAANRPGGRQTTFYNTQGRRLDLPAGTTRISAELFFPEDWVGADKRRRSDLWAIATTYDENGDPAEPLYPILGIANVNGTPVIRYWDDTVGAGGDWVVTSITPVPNTWYRIDFVLDTANQAFIYYVNGTEVGRFNSLGALEMESAFIQAYNFNDPTLDPDMQSDESYDAYWDNFSYNFQLRSLTQPDLTVGRNRAQSSQSGAGIYSSNPNRQRVSSTSGYRGKVRQFVSVTNSGAAGDLPPANLFIKVNGIKNRKFNVRVVRIDGNQGDVTGSILRNNYKLNLASTESAQYRVVTRLKDRNPAVKRRVSHNIILRGISDGGVDSAKLTANFRTPKRR